MTANDRERGAIPTSSSAGDEWDDRWDSQILPDPWLSEEDWTEEDEADEEEDD